jgi:hypothetical protein
MRDERGRGLGGGSLEEWIGGKSCSNGGSDKKEKGGLDHNRAMGHSPYYHMWKTGLVSYAFDLSLWPKKVAS